MSAFADPFQPEMPIKTDEDLAYAVFKLMQALDKPFFVSRFARAMLGGSVSQHQGAMKRMNKANLEIEQTVREWVAHYPNGRDNSAGSEH